MSLTRLAWRGVLARPLRSLLSTLGVAMGTAVLLAGLATNAGIEAAVATAVDDQVGRTDLRVAAFGEVGLSTETVKLITETPGVSIVAPALERRTYLVGDPGAGGGAVLPAPVTVLGIDPVWEPILHDFPLVEGSPLVKADERHALVSERLADEDGLRIGATIAIQGVGDRVDLRIVGILAGDGPLSGALGRTVVVPLAAAQAAFGDDGMSRVDLGLDAGVGPSEVTDSLEDRLVLQPYVIATPAEIGAALRGSTASFQATAALIAAVTLFAGAFLVFNTLSMTVVEQVRTVGLLRAAGATRGQVMRFMLSQAITFGVIGSMIGVAIGALLALGMVAWVRTVGAVTLAQPAIPPDAVVAAFLGGVGVTLAAALEPARRAGRIQPVEALKARLDLPSARRARLRWLAAVLVGVSLVGLLVAPRAAGVAQPLAVYAVLLAATMLIPAVLPAVARLAGVPFALLLRLEERLARASVVRDRSRAAMTLSALTIGLAMMVALVGVGQHARIAAAGWITDVIPGELVLTSIRPVRADEGIRAEIMAAVPGVVRMSPMATFEMAIAGIRADAAAVVGADLAADGRLRFLAGERDTALAAIDAGGAAIVPSSLATRLGLGVGQALTIPSATGQAIGVRVVGVVERSIPGSIGEAILLGWRDATALGVSGADSFAVRFAADAGPDARAALRDVAVTYALDYVTIDRVKGAVDAALGRVFGLFDALALVAVLIAALAIVNTLTMNVIERVREIGVLRAVGMTRRQVWRSVVVEAGILGLAGALLGLGLGLAIGALMVVFAGGAFDLAVAVSWPVVGLTVGLGVSLSMLAAAYPARMAAGLPIIRAVQFE